MENNNQAQTNQEQAKPAENSSGKPQRKLKFKTLDGKMVDLVCDYDIKIIDLKKKLEEIYKIEPIRQRLLNKGKQFKDNQTLDKLVDKDDTIIHLVFRSESDVKAAQENAANNNQNNNTNNNTQNQNHPNINIQGQNGNPLSNILNMLYIALLPGWSSSFRDSNCSSNFGRRLADCSAYVKYFSTSSSIPRP